jgi:NAD(P)-dependent dehydrogenase (short-subunit alcohol dehydrogenase family)
MRTLALEYASRGVTANAVLPGVTDTEMARQALAKVRERVEGAILMKQIGQPEDITQAMAYLCSHRAAFVTGQCLSPNGGT